MRGGHAFERVQRFFCLALLKHAHNSVKHHDKQNKRRFKKFHGIALYAGYDKRNHGGGQQYKYHNILKLVEKTLQIGFLFLFLQAVLSILRAQGVNV